MPWATGYAPSAKVCHKKIEETDAIFEQLASVHEQAHEDNTVLRLSIDAKASVKVGPFSRHGQSRVIVNAVDHDFKATECLTPFGIFLPDYDEVYLYFAPSSLTADFIVDCLDDFWQSVQASFPTVTTLLINLDNGPENNSRRTQFIQRLVSWVDTRHLTLQLAYYPPYHSKYNPVERVWGVLEQHWNGSLLDSRQTVLRLASTMTYNGLSPFVKFIDRSYQTGIRLSKHAMSALERRLDRLPLLGKWFVRIVPQC
jgi:DDE family transposase